MLSLIVSIVAGTGCTLAGCYLLFTSNASAWRRSRTGMIDSGKAKRLAIMTGVGMICIGLGCLTSIGVSNTFGPFSMLPGSTWSSISIVLNLVGISMATLAILRYNGRFMG